MRLTVKVSQGQIPAGEYCVVYLTDSDVAWAAVCASEKETAYILVPLRDSVRKS